MRARYLPSLFESRDATDAWKTFKRDHETDCRVVVARALPSTQKRSSRPHFKGVVLSAVAREAGLLPPYAVGP